MQEYVFENYNKMEDNIMYLGSNAILKMNVNLYNQSEKYGRRSYHQEVQYYNEKIGQKTIILKRSFDYFATIENLKPVDHIKEYIMLRQQDIFLLRKVVNSVYEKYIENFDNIFTRKGGIVTIKKTLPIELGDLTRGKYLVFIPDIIEGMSGEKTPAIRINLSSPTNYVLMGINNFYGFIETMNNMDMFGYAQTMLSYFGKPSFGTNLYDFSNKQDIEDTVIAKKGRVVQASKPKGKSYFAQKMEELE